MRRSWVRVPVLALARPSAAMAERDARSWPRSRTAASVGNFPSRPVPSSPEKYFSTRPILPVIVWHPCARSSARGESSRSSCASRSCRCSIFPLSSYSVKSQEWWLPVLLTVLVLISLVQLLIRKSTGVVALVPGLLRPGSQHHQQADDAAAARNEEQRRRSGCSTRVYVDRRHCRRCSCRRSRSGTTSCRKCARTVVRLICRCARRAY